MAARLFSASPSCFLRCWAASASTSPRCSASRWPRAWRWSARGRALSRVQAWKADHELGVVDQPDLEGQQAEEKVAVGVSGHQVCLQRRGPVRASGSARRRGSGDVSRRISRIIAYWTWPVIV